MCILQSNAAQQYAPRSPFTPYSPLSLTAPAIPTHSPQSSAAGLWFGAPGARLAASPTLRYRVHTYSMDADVLYVATSARSVDLS